MRESLVVLILLGVMVAGCAEPEASEPAESAAPEPEPEAEAPQADNATQLPNIAPSAMLGVEGLDNGTLNVTVPMLVNFTLDGADADGDALDWSLDVNGTEVANGTELPAMANHTFDMAGLYNVTFMVSDGAASNVTQIVVNATVMEDLGPWVAGADDPGGDGEQFAEIRRIDAVNDGTTLTVVLTLDDVWPSTDLLSAATYSLNVNGRLLNSFVRYAIDSNPMTWDTAETAYMPAGTSKWTDTTVTFTIPLSYLEGKGTFAPYEVHATANYGALNTREVQDRVPDTGKLPPI